MQQKTLNENIGKHGLFRALKANDENALGKFYKDNYKKVEKYILANNGTIADAKDTYQEAFLAAWRNIQLEKFYPQNENALEGYIYRIAKNKWLDHLGSAHYKKTAAMHAESADVADELLPEEDEDFIADVKNQFKNLGENCREVLTRFYYKKESMRVIAEKFAWTEATAKNNKYRCLQRLRELLRKQNHP